MNFVQAKEIVKECGPIEGAGDAHHPRPRLGPMIELPSAVEVADELATEADFLCIGTNDLVQYILAVDRTNEQLADHYLPYHPAVLRSLKRVADAAEQHGVMLSVCGDMASDPALLPFLIGIGIRALSVDVRNLPKLQKNIGALDLASAKSQAAEMLAMGRSTRPGRLPRAGGGRRADGGERLITGGDTLWQACLPVSCRERFPVTRSTKTRCPLRFSISVP